MTNPIQAMLEAGVVEATDFPPESRYHGAARRTFMLPDGTQVPYVARRFVPPPENFATIGSRAVAEGERLDQISAETLATPEAWWSFADSNGALWAEELETPGTRLRLTLPEGVPAPEDDQ
jgi:hypothetical protein